MPHKKSAFESIHAASWNQAQLNRILTQSRGKKILVVGDVGLDRYTIGDVERISPEAPVPIVLVREEKFKLGLTANVADNIQALKGIPILIGIVGRDRGAEDFRSLLKSVGVKSSHLIVDRSRRTVLKERVVSDRQQLVRIDYESLHPISLALEKQILMKVRSLLPQVDAVIVEDYGKGMLTASLIHSVFHWANRAGKAVAVDPNSKTPLKYYRGATVLTPNTKEAENLSGVIIRDSDSLAKAGKVILRATLARHVVITRGKDGMAIFTQGQRVIKLIPTYARDVYDVSGAGDTVISVLALALASGASIENASVLGNIAAGVEVGKRGTATVSKEEIQMALEFFLRVGV